MTARALLTTDDVKPDEPVNRIEFEYVGQESSRG